MKKNTIVFVLLSVFTVNTFSQEIGVKERLSNYIPIFSSPICANYMIPFGANQQKIDQTAERLGLEFVEGVEMPDLEGAYMLVYTDPDNILDRNGREVTENIFYIFTIDPNEIYFSFSVVLNFTSSVLATSVEEKMREYLDLDGDSEQETFITECNEKKSKARGSKRFITIKRNVNTLTFVIVDLDVVKSRIQGNYYKL